MLPKIAPAFVAISLLLSPGLGAAPAFPAVRYASTARENVLDLYLPAQGENHPVVLLVHGGGWVGGSRKSKREASVAEDLAAAGYAVASMDYRLAPGSPWPAQQDDIHDALRFLADHAGEYKLDMNRLALFGGSAGGHLALMTAYTQAAFPGLPKIRAVIAFYPITNLLTRRETDQAGVSSPALNEGSAPKLLGGPMAANPELWRKVSPSSHVSAAVPPTFLAHGKRDAIVNWEQSTELAETLKTVGVPHEIVLVEGAGHTFDLKAGSRDLKPDVTAFLARHLPAPAKQ